MGAVVELVVPTEQQGNLALPVRDLIIALEDCLDKARTGELRAMGFVCITDKGEVLTGSKSAMDEAHRITLLGALAILTNRLSIP